MRPSPTPTLLQPARPIFSDRLRRSGGVIPCARTGPSGSSAEPLNQITKYPAYTHHAGLRSSAGSLSAARISGPREELDPEAAG